MKAGFAYLAATLATWVGWFLLARAVWLLAPLAARWPVEDRGRLLARTGWTAAAGLVFVAAAKGAAGGQGFGIPLVWVVMSAFGWIAVASIGMAVVRAVQAFTAVDPDLRRAKAVAGGVWVGVAVAATFAQRRWGGDVEVLRGFLPADGATLGVIAGAAVLSVVTMALSARVAHRRGLKTVGTHLVLLAGSAVFGLPFAWLLVTSFKEDRDMASTEGMVWIPKVQEERPFLDVREPLYVGKMDGRTVQGIVVERRPDGGATVEVQRPMAIRGLTFEAGPGELQEIPKRGPVVSGVLDGVSIKGMVIEELKDGSRRVRVIEPKELQDREHVFKPAELQPVRNPGLRWRNYTEALEYLPPETNGGLVYLRNTLVLVLMSVIGTVLSSAIVAYAFSRLAFPGRDGLFKLMLSTMMLPAAVTLLPTFLIFRSLGWIDTLYPLWVPTFFAGAFNVFLLRQFLLGIPKELEDAAKIDGCSYLRTFWSVMVPQIKPALVVVAIWTFMGAWNNFMGPLIYISSPENMPISYALQLFQGERSGEPGLLMAFATMAMLPVLALFFLAQRYFIEGAQLSGLGGR